MHTMAYKWTPGVTGCLNSVVPQYASGSCKQTARANSTASTNGAETLATFQAAGGRSWKVGRGPRVVSKAFLADPNG